MWFFARFVRRFGCEAKRDESTARLVAGRADGSDGGVRVGCSTYDAFSFIQVTFVMFVLVGLGSAAMAERPLPAVVAARRAWIGVDTGATRPTA